jgi:hypothetical protein
MTDKSNTAEQTVIPPTADPAAPPAASEKKELAAMTSGGSIAAIVPRDHVEAFRFAEGFIHAGMIPASYMVKRNAQGKEVKEWEDGVVDEKATKSRIAIGIMKGMEIGLPPVTALSTICVINNRPCLWGDGAVALVSRSGKLEYIKDSSTGDWNKGDYVHTVTVKRKDSTEEITRSFGFADAKAASLIGKKGPWSAGYGPRMCFNRARAWALRDAFSDVLLGIGIAEEVRDIPPEGTPETRTDISSLDDAPAQIAAPTADPQPQDELDKLLDGDKSAPQRDEIDPDWQSVIDQLKPALKSCENMAQFQLFWVDNTKVITSFDRAPDNVKALWKQLTDEQKAKFKK